MESPPISPTSVMEGPKIEPQYEAESQWIDPKKVEFVLEFVDTLHKSLVGEQLENTDDVTALYQKVVRKITRKYKCEIKKADINRIYSHLVKNGKLAPSYIIETLTTTRAVRSQSGVLPISIATDGNNFSCAYDCHFCPDERKEKGAPRDMSRSYLSSEGTFIRGAIEDFKPAGQVWRRLLELELMGHPPDKCEMIILGGTWDSYDADYRDYFIHQVKFFNHHVSTARAQLFYACNVFHHFSLRMHGELSGMTKEWANRNPFTQGMAFDPEGKIQALLRPPKSLEEEKAENENAPCARIIGIVLETRPDQISKASLMRKRRLGCTRLQLGIQHVDDEILKLNNRGHGVDKSISAIAYARDAGFKVDGHLMPDLPGTTEEKDMELVQRVFHGDELQLDYCKLYPCLDLPYTVTREWKEQGIWKPMAEHDFPTFLNILRYAMATVPPWTRVNRVHRDFPEAIEKNGFLGFVSENIKSNLQQMVMAELKKHGQACYDIRSREIRGAYPFGYETRARLFIRCYRANAGTEFFLSVEVPNKNARCSDDALLMGLLRLRLTDVDVRRLAGEDVKIPFHYLPEFAQRPLARVRELHVYGSLKMVTKAHATTGTNSQHTGVGKFLMGVAERVAAAYGFNELSVISGVGVREYYRRLGYEMDPGKGEYLVKDVSDRSTMLPTALFGRTLAASDIILPLTKLAIAREHLPEPRLTGMSMRTSIPAHPWFSIHAYDHLQEGRAQLLIVDVPPGPIVEGARYAHWILLGLALLVALLAIYLRANHIF